LPVSQGQVTITDDGQTQTVPVQNDSATADFSFWFGLQVLPHQVTAVYTDPGGVFGSSSANTSAAGTPQQAADACAQDLLLFFNFA
jgi:hypothetical protein